MSTLLENARALAERETTMIDGANLIRLCKAFGRGWIGEFTSPSRYPYGREERVLVLCMAHVILKRGRR